MLVIDCSSPYFDVQMRVVEDVVASLGAANTPRIEVYNKIDADADAVTRPDGSRISGFIDLGRSGIGCKYRDIALAYRSLLHNYDGTFDGRPYPGFDPDILFDALEMKPDRERIRYYILLDELF